MQRNWLAVGACNPNLSTYASVKRRYKLDQMSLHTLLHVTNFLYLGRPSARLRALAKPLLAALRPEDGVAAVGLHARMGDTELQNVVDWEESRFPPECGPRTSPNDQHHSRVYGSRGPVPVEDNKLC